MSNMLLAMPVSCDSAVLKSSSTAGGLPASNLKTSPIGQVARFLTPAACFVQTAISCPVDLIAILGHNGSTTGQARVRAADSVDDILTSPDYDSGALPLRSNQPDFTGSNTAGAMDTNHFILHLGAPLTHNYWRIDISDASLPYFDAGRLYISKAWQPETNMDYGIAHGFVDPSKTERTVSGRQVPLVRPAYRYAEFQLSFGSEQEMFDNAFEIDRLRGTTKDVLFINDPDNISMIQKRTIYGTMQGLPPIINAQFRLYEKSYRIEEIIE